MKKLTAVLLAAILSFSVIPTLAVTSTDAETTAFTPEQYMLLMGADETFNLKAYMYYNQDLMSKFTYDYWKYYKHYLERGKEEGRAALFPEGSPYSVSTLGCYTTQYKNNTPRGTNVELACDYMNGTIVLPGAVFSYNDVIGVRNSARGFKVATIYMGGELAQGIGGGICQISSTTYVAMMIAGIPPLERHRHSLPVSYLKPNLDATVSYGKLDLKFVNPFTFPIVICSTYDGNGNCTVAINRYV